MRDIFPHFFNEHLIQKYKCQPSKVVGEVKFLLLLFLVQINVSLRTRYN